MTIRVGVVGGAYGATSHLPTFAALPAYDVVAVATGRQSTADAVAARFGVRPVVGYEALCADPDVDLVCVVTRPSRHEEMVLAAAAAGKHVFCEAPLAMSVASGERMAGAVATAGVVGVVGMQSRFSAGVWQLRELVRSGWLGTVENVAATAFYPTFTRPEAVAGSGWCADARNGASSLRVHGLHTADVVRWMLGEFTDVSGVAATRRAKWPGGAPATSVDSAVVAGLVGGAPCSIHTSWVAGFGGGWRLELHGSAGRLVATADGHTGHFPVTVSADRQLPDHTPEPRHAIAPEAPNYGLAGLLCRLADVLEGKPDEDLPTFADGQAMLRIATAVDGLG